MLENEGNWYLVRTKPGKERWVRDQLSAILPAVFLPMLEAKASRWGKMRWSIGPLFPGYIFARFDLRTHYYEVKYRAGVQGLVSAGNDPLMVPAPVVEEIKARGLDGIVRIEEKPLERGDHVQVVEGHFQGFEAIFDRYLSGAERVAILLSTVEAKGVRMVLPAVAVAKSSG